MRVDGGYLRLDTGEPVDFTESPNHSAGIDPRFVVMHYTAGRGFEQSVRWLCNPKAKASAHVVVGRGGEAAQLVPFDRRAWHAGKSSWDLPNASPLRGELERTYRSEGPTTLYAMNRWSIGIELDNAGVLHETARGYCTWWGAEIDVRDVVLANGRAWHRYTDVQIQIAYEVCEALIDAYPQIEDVIGHEDIAPGRKLDPGPAFPMQTFRSWLFGREDK